MAGIRVMGVGKWFGRVRALEDVSFEVPEGSLSTLLGPSGCGKSTLLRLIAGLERPDSGSITIGDRLVSSEHRFVPPERREIGFVFQAYALWPHMKVSDQVAYPLRSRHVSKSELRTRVADILETVGLSNEADRYPSELSGGQQQRVALARALVFRPNVLLLDEPLSNLDAALRVRMREELYLLHQRINVTTVHVTHDQREALSLSDTVIVMDAGSVLEVGTPEQIYSRPNSALVASHVGSGNALKGTLVNVCGGVGEAVIDGPSRIAGRLAVPMKTGDHVTAFFRPEDARVVPRSDDHENQILAQVTSRMYFGDYVRLRLRVGGTDATIQAERSIHAVPGQQISFCVRQENVMIFSELSEAASNGSAPCDEEQLSLDG